MCRTAHVRARGPQPSYPERFPVPDDKLAWSTQWPEYAPVEFVTDSVLQQASDTSPGGWADPPTPVKELVLKRGSHELTATRRQWHWDSLGRPCNPRGRTGISNRGRLGKWGPNHAGDAIVTRHNPHSPNRPLEFVAMKRKDTGEWALPGGFVAPNELASATLRREFSEEVGAMSGEERRRFSSMLDELFVPENGRVVYRGYVDDPRNTDHAWIETMCMHFHLPDHDAALLPLKAGDDASEVRWLEVGQHNPLYTQLYASHRQMVDCVLETHGATAMELAPAAAPTREGMVGAVGQVDVRIPPTLPALLREFTKAVLVAGHTAPEHVVIFARDHFARLAAQLAHPPDGAPVGALPLAGPPATVDTCPLSTQELLDVFTTVAAHAPILRSVLNHIRELNADYYESERVVSEIAAALVPEDEPVAANVYENLHALMPWSSRIPPLRAFAASVLSRIDSWQHDDTGSIERAPSIPDAHCIEISSEQQMLLKRLVFVIDPPSMLNSRLLREKRALLFHSGATSSATPTVIITIGAPGSGKSYVTMRHFAPLLHESGSGPATSEYLTIDPDFWLTNVCQNDNSMRHLANYLNHETFLLALRMRRNMVFDGTGRSLLNTCSRVVARLKPQGYRIHFCVVLSSFERCLSNIAQRREKTGRDVPAKFVRATFEGLREACKVYVQQQATLSEQLVIYDNDSLNAELVATVRDGNGVDEALALVDKFLQLPEE